MRRLALAITVALTAASASAQSMSPRKVEALPSSQATLREAYGPLPQNFGELRLPPGKGPFPVAILVHGGCWKNRWDLRHFTPLATALTAKGFATWTIEYRRIGDPGAGWPGTFEDWGLAADHVRQLARRYPLNLKRVITVGHSAGAQGAIWIAGRPGLPKATPGKGKHPISVRTIVDMDGPPVVALYADTGRDKEVCGSPVVSEFMGGAPSAAPERYRLGDIGAQLPRKTPMLVVSSDVLTRAEADAYITRARAAGDRLDTLDLTGTGHFDMIAPGTSAYQAFEAFLLEKALK